MPKKKARKSSKKKSSPKKKAPKRKKAVKKKAVKKKAAKKTVVKKKAVAKPKRTVRVVVSSKILGDAPVEKQFILSDGKKLKSVYDLVDALEKMNENMFRSHVNDMKHDFGNWIGDVFEERNFAKHVKKIKDKIKLQREIMKKIVQVAKHHGK